MKKLLLTLSICLPLVAVAQLPDRTSTLVKKLNEWELEKKALLQKEIEAKRAEVIKVLQQHQQETTKDGDLEGALAIKAEIERLSKNSETTQNLSIDEQLPSTPSELVKWLDGNVISFTDNHGPRTIEFDRKTAYFSTLKKDARKPCPYDVIDEGTIKFTENGVEREITLNKDRKNCIITRTAINQQFKGVIKKAEPN